MSDTRGLSSGVHRAQPSTKRLLEDLIWDAGAIGRFDDGRDMLITTPLVILPFERQNNTLVGIFVDAQQQRYTARIGFRQRTDGPSDHYYDVGNEGQLQSVFALTPGVTYLPLCRTGVDISYTGSDKVPHTVPLYGLFGEYNSLPLLCVFPNKKKRHFRVIAKQDNNPLLLIPNATVPTEAVDAVLSSVRKGTYQREPLDKELQRIEPSPSAVAEMTKKSDIRWDEPRSIVEYLDHYVIGQEQAKRTLAVAFSNYQLGLTQNCVFYGPSGSGKTYANQVLGKAAQLHVVITQASNKSGTGFKGDSPSDGVGILSKLTESKEPRGVIIIDEFDKLATTPDFGSFNPGMQDEYIGFIEGGTVDGVSTKNILFVAAGAFQSGRCGKSLADIVRERLRPPKQMGFLREIIPSKITDEEALALVQEQDLVTYGIKVELIGRFAVRAAFNPLSVDDKVRILRDAKESELTKIQGVLQKRGYHLDIDPDIFPLLAHASPKEFNARGLRGVCARVLEPYLYDPAKYATAGKRLLLSADLVRSRLESYTPQIVNG